MPIDDYDPRPEKYRNKTDTHMKKFLDAVCGKGLGVSLLLDPSTRYWGENTQPDVLPPDLPIGPLFHRWLHVIPHMAITRVIDVDFKMFQTTRSPMCEPP